VFFDGVLNFYDVLLEGSGVASYLAGLWIGASLIFFDGMPGRMETKDILAKAWGYPSLFPDGLWRKKHEYFHGAILSGWIGRMPWKVRCSEKDCFNFNALGNCGLICAPGTIWNYVGNIKWYGQFQRPVFMQSHVSKN